MNLQQHTGILRQVCAVLFLVGQYGHVVHLDNCYSDENREAEAQQVYSGRLNVVAG